MGRKSTLTIKTLQGGEVKAHHIEKMKRDKKDGGHFYMYYKVSEDGKSRNAMKKEDAESSGLKIRSTVPKAKSCSSPPRRTKKSLKMPKKALETSGQASRLVTRRMNKCMKRCEEDSASLTTELNRNFGDLPASAPRPKRVVSASAKRKAARVAANKAKKAATAPAKKASSQRKPGRPVGSKNKKSCGAQANSKKVKKAKASA
jgi:hypothetical protein